MTTFMVSVFVALRGRLGHADFGDWVDIGVAHAETYGAALDQIGGDQKRNVELGHCGFMSVDGVEVCIKPVVEITGPENLLEQHRATMNRMLGSGAYLPDPPTDIKLKEGS